MPSLFDYIQNIQNDTPLSDTSLKNYVPFAINRGLSNYIDCIMFASQMNMLHNLPSNMQYDFLSKSIRKGKRYGKWAKQLKLDRADADNIKMISEYYNINLNRASAYMEILNDDELEKIRKMKGG